MCGIAGAVGELEGFDLLAMPASMAHRGPDDEGVFSAVRPDGSAITLANTRLAILGLGPQGHQPMSSTDGRLTVVHNGEIYNFREIAAELRSTGVRFEGGSDTEVILAAWRELGPECVKRFRGMFAFAIYDREDGRLFLVRDRLGEKPLYHWSNGRALLFASEVRTLLEAGVPRILDRDGLDSYLTFGSVCDPLTLVRGVHALPPGSVSEVSGIEPKTRTYWSLRTIDEAKDAPHDLMELTKDRLSSACALATESDVPIGVLLSGGIDSSACVALLSEQSISDLRTFNVVFPSEDRRLDEDRWATIVAQRFKTEHHRIEVGLNEAHKWVADGVGAMDQPSIDGTNTYIVTRAIGTAGIKVALSGLGGDELFLGYANRDRFARFARIARSDLGWVAGLGQKMASLTGQRRLKAERLTQLLGKSSDPFARSYVACRSLYSQRALNALVGEGRPQQARFVEGEGGRSIDGRLSRLELGNYLRNTLLRDGDQMSMANSVELRQPFLDVELVEHALAVPSEVKVQPGRQKPLLVEPLAGLLPQEVWERPKMGFQLPFDRWLRQGLRVGEPLDVDLGLDREAVADVRAGFMSGAYYAPYWALQVVAAWIDANRVRPS